MEMKLKRLTALLPDKALSCQITPEDKSCITIGALLFLPAMTKGCVLFPTGGSNLHPRLDKNFIIYLFQHVIIAPQPF
jgi:hypothetical protein